MRVHKDEVIGLLRARGEHDKAAMLRCALPQHVDTDVDAGLLAQHQITVSEIAAGPAATRTR